MHNLSATKRFLKDILSDAASPQAMGWLETQVEKIKKAAGQMKFFWPLARHQGIFQRMR